MPGLSHDSLPIITSACRDDIIFKSWAGLPLVFMDWQFKTTIRMGRSFRFRVSLSGGCLVGEEVPNRTRAQWKFTNVYHQRSISTLIAGSRFTGGQ